MTLFKKSSGLEFSFFKSNFLLFCFFLILSPHTSFAEQQIVIHWTSETDLTSANLLKDRNGQLLDSGNTNNGDGYLVTLGYFTDGNSTHPFGMDGTKWIPLTAGTRVGDSSSGYGYADGTFSFTTVFTRNSNVVSVYPNEPANYAVNSQHILESNKPPFNQQLCIRFYDRTITGPSARYNTVTGPNWKWPAWSTGSVPKNYYFKISNGDSTRSEWEYGSNFEDPDNNFSTSLQVKANLTASVSTGGSLNPDPTGAHDYGSVVQLRAVPTDVHWEFDQWTGSGITKPSDANTTVLMSQDRNVTALFQVRNYNVTITKIGKGTVSSSDIYRFGSNVNVSATPDFGYQFSHWDNFDSNSIPTTGLDNNLSSSATLTVQGVHALRAVFDPLPYTITVNSTVGGNATIMQAPGPYLFDNTYTLSSNAEYGYSFNNWSSSSNSENLLSSTTSSISSFTLNGNVSFTGNFSENQYLLTVQVGAGGASALPANPTYYSHSTQVPVTATALEGYEFDRWEDSTGSILDFTDINSTVIMSRNAADVTVKALFKPKQYSVTLTANTGGQVSITPTIGPWEHFKVYPILATPDAGYQFFNWTGGVSSMNSLTGFNTDQNNSLAITGPLSLNANFSLVDYNVSATLSSGNGNVSGSGSYTINDNPQVSAVAGTGWHFSQWTGDVFALNSNSSQTSSINLLQNPQNISVQASFERNGYTINVDSHGSGLINGQSSLSLSPVFQDLVELNATASTGWEFDRWYGYSFANAQLENVSLSASSNLELNASFQRKQYTLSIGTSSFGESNGSGVYSFEANASISAIPNTGYVFSGWTGDTQYVTDLNSTTTIVTIPNSSVSVTPTFTPINYQITVSSDSNGTVSGGGSYPYGTIANIIPTGNGQDPNNAPAGYTLESWSITDQAGQVTKRSDNRLSLVVDGNYTIFANFEPIIVALHDLNITTSSVSGGQIFNDTSLREWNASNATLSSVITATPNPGYSFIGWHNPDNKSISPDFKSPRITFTTDSNASLIAQFSKDIIDTTIRISGNGSVQSESNETSLVFNANPNVNNDFTKWQVDHNYSYNVTLGSSSVNSSAQVFFLNGKESPSIRLLKGYTYQFNCNTGSHEFYLSTENNSTNYNQEFTDSNLSGSRTTNGSLIFTVPHDFNTTIDLYYCSADNSFMGNKIDIIDSIADSSIIPFPNQRTITPNVSHDLSLLADFNLNQYNVIISSGNGGTVSTGSSGSYTHGTTLNLTASPNLHFVFSHWEGATFLDANSTSTSSSITSHSQINAIFSPILYNLTLTQNITEAGNLFSSSNTYKFPHGTVVPIQANPNSGYIFTSWSNGITSPTTNITMDGNTTLAATFNRKPATIGYLISTTDILGNSEDGKTGGYISPSDLSGYKVGESLQVTANDYPGYQFVNWIEDNNETDSSRTKTLFLDENQTITAVFKKLSFEVNLFATPLIGGQINTNIGTTAEVQKLTIAWGDTVNISSFPSTNYQFEQWSGNGLDGLNTTDPNIELVIKDNVDVSAKFIPLQPLDLRIIIEPQDSGFVIGNGGFAYNTNHPIYATPNAGYLFDRWEGVGIENASLQNSTILLNEDKTIKAKFKIDPNYVGTGNPSLPGLHSLTIINIPSNLGTTTGGGVFGTGWVDISAMAVTGYKFSYWDGAGVENNTSKDTRFFLTSNTTLSAVFRAMKGSDLLSDATSLGNSWWYSDWFGPFWHREADLWIYHAPLGWIYIIPEDDAGSVWFWVDYLSGWQWSLKTIFPYHRAHTQAKWFWFNKAQSTQEARLFYEYNDANGAGSWIQF